MNEHRTSVLFGSARTGESEQDRWCTPRSIFDELHTVYAFDCDAAAVAATALCGSWFGPDHPDAARRDALASAARWGSSAWLNPPYSQMLAFMAAVCRQADAGARVVVLCPARPDTGWWWRYVLGRRPAGSRRRGGPAPGTPHGGRRATEIRWIPGRVTFDRPPGANGSSGPAPFPSVVLVYEPGEQLPGWPEQGVYLAP